MKKKFVTIASALLKKRVANINQHLDGEQLYVYESGTKYLVIALVNTQTLLIRARCGLNIQAKRDQHIAKAFLNLVESSRAQKTALAA